MEDKKPLKIYLVENKKALIKEINPKTPKQQ
jgi:hypothetical protein